MAEGDGTTRKRRWTPRSAPDPLRELHSELSSLGEGLTVVRSGADEELPPARSTRPGARYTLAPPTPARPEPPSAAPPWPGAPSAPRSPQPPRPAPPPTPRWALREPQAPAAPGRRDQSWAPREPAPSRDRPAPTAARDRPAPADRGGRSPSGTPGQPPLSRAPRAPALRVVPPPAPLRLPTVPATSTAPAATAPAAAYVPSKVGGPPRVELSDASDRSSRPWTPELAMEPLPPLSPADLGPMEAAAVVEPPPRSKLMTATVVIAAAAAIFVMVASHLDLAHTQAPSFAVNEITATGPAGGPLLAPGHFPTTAREIDVVASYVGAATGDALTLQVTFGSTSFPARTAPLAPGTGTVGAAVFPVGKAFQPGVYTVKALWQGRIVRSQQFTVDAPGAAPPPG